MKSPLARRSGRRGGFAARRSVSSRWLVATAAALALLAFLFTVPAAGEILYGLGAIKGTATTWNNPFDVKLSNSLKFYFGEGGKWWDTTKK